MSNSVNANNLNNPSTLNLFQTTAPVPQSSAAKTEGASQTFADSYEPSGTSIARKTVGDVPMCTKPGGDISPSDCDSNPLGGIGECISGLCEMIMGVVSTLVEAIISVPKAILECLCGAFGGIFGGDEAKPLDEEDDDAVSDPVV